MKLSLAVVIVWSVLILTAFGMAVYIAHDMHTHPERTYSVACKPQHFVRMFSVGKKTFAVCGSQPYDSTTDFRIVEIPDD